MKTDRINETPIPPEELGRFLELSIDARTDDYLRRLALLAIQSADIAATSPRLDVQVERLEKLDHSLTEQSAILAAIIKRSYLDRIKGLDRVRNRS